MDRTYPLFASRFDVGLPRVLVRCGRHLFVRGFLLGLEEGGRFSAVLAVRDNPLTVHKQPGRVVVIVVVEAHAHTHTTHTLCGRRTPLDVRIRCESDSPRTRRPTARHRGTNCSQLEIYTYGLWCQSVFVV